jgi:putative flippase GtrA
MMCLVIPHSALLARSRKPLMFIGVGCAAAIVHLLMALLLVRNLAMHPLSANVVAWLCAFGVSFAGHQLLTFREQDAPWRRAVMRFFVVSAGGFCLNEAAYACLLRWSALSYDAALVLVLAGVAVLTYAMGRHWAFLGNATLRPPTA